MKNHRHLPVIAAAVAVTVLGATTATSTCAADIRQRFESISIGMSRSEVLSIMPAPTSSIESSWLGMPCVQLRWSNGPWRPAFLVNFVGNHAYAKRACDRPSDC